MKSCFCFVAVHKPKQNQMIQGRQDKPSKWQRNKEMLWHTKIEIEICSFFIPFWFISTNILSANSCQVFEGDSSIQTAGMHNSNLMAGHRNFFGIAESQIWYVLTHSKDVFIKRDSQANIISRLGGQINSFRGPHLACGPYVVHPWFKAKSRLKWKKAHFYFWWWN